MIWEMDIRGGHRFSSLMKQKIKGKNCAVFCFAGKRKIFFIYLWSDYLGKKKKKLQTILLVCVRACAFIHPFAFMLYCPRMKTVLFSGWRDVFVEEKNNYREYNDHPRKRCGCVSVGDVCLHIPRWRVWFSLA